MKIFNGFLSMMLLSALALGMWACQKEESVITDDSSIYALSSIDPDQAADPCYKLVFPVKVKLPDGKVVEVANQDELNAILRKSGNNPGRVRAHILFPYDVILKNGNQVTVNGPEDLARITRACRTKVNPDSSERQCYTLQFPLTFALPDGNTVTVTSKEEFEAFLKRWQESGNTGRPKLTFPYNVKLQDGTILTINNEDDLRNLQEMCRKGRKPVDPKPTACFEIQFPLQVKLANGDIVTVNSQDELNKLLNSRPTTNGRAAIQFPYSVKLSETGEIIVINNEEDLRKLNEKCRMR